MYHHFFKRLLDIGVSVFLLFLLSPFILVISVILYIRNGGDIFYYHRRPGRDEKPFYLIKFKTMSDEVDKDGRLLPDMERITWIGEKLRKLSLDELPQLLNVLKGDMSLIGPRPLLFKYLPLYSKKQRKRHLVRPGITGWAQVNGRNSISWGKKFELDLYYVNNISFTLDLKILWLTAVKVLKREGINQSEARPMQPFDGTN